MVYFLLEIIYLDLGFYILSGVFDMVNFVFGLGFTELAPLLLAQVYKPNSKNMLNRKMVFGVTKSQSMKDK